MRQKTLTDPDGVLVIPENHCGTGILTIGGSSGRIDERRAQVFAEQGALAMSIRWFGGAGQPAGPRLVPLETFTTALSRLAPECDRLLIAGTSFGAEAALLVASYDENVWGCIGFAPGAHAWSYVDQDGSQVSHWSYGGRPVPSVPFDLGWQPDTDPPAYVGNYRQSLRTANPETVANAAIPVERIDEVLLLAGGDDQVWPSVDFADQVARRRSEHGLDTSCITLADAGHRTVLPGENPIVAGKSMRRGGTEEADRELGRRAWPEIRRLVRGG